MFTDRRANSLMVARKKQPWPKDKPFKILSLDGGGIRGAYAAKLLELMEAQLTGSQPVAKFFDMVAGTSTGGIIGIGLGLGVPAKRIASLYLRRGREIFPKRFFDGYPKLKFLRHLTSSLYDADKLEMILAEEYGEATIGDSISRLVVPAFMIPKTEIAVIKTDHHQDFRNDWRTPAWQAARATSAAPAYVDGIEANGKIFIDGGVWANNPIMVAIVDVLSAYDVEREQIQVLSIGTGDLPFETGFLLRGAGLIAWKEIIKSAMYLTSDNALAQAQLLLGHSNICRLDPADAALGIELDDVEMAVANLVPRAEADFSEHRESIDGFFSDLVSLREKFYSA